MSKDAYIIGVDIGGTSVKLGFFSAEGALYEKWSMPTCSERGSEVVVWDISQSIIGVLIKNGVSQEAVRGIGVGVPGPVENGVVLGCPNLDWGDVAIERLFKRHFNLPVIAENDANLAALGELWQGGAKGCDSFAMLTLGTGVGGAVVHNGQIFKGANGCAGEFGHITVCPDETHPCGCGRFGCLEQYASATGLTNTARSLFKAGVSTELKYDNLTAASLLQSAREEDELAVKAVEDMAKNLGIAMANIAVVCDPKLFLIGGGVSQAGEFLRAKIERYYRRFAFDATQQTPIALASLKNDAGIWGAASLFSSQGMPVEK